jgi:hypothetical protein
MKIKQKIRRLFIMRKAYKGYCEYCKRGNEKPLSFEWFKKNGFIELCYIMYKGYFIKAI